MVPLADKQYFLLDSCIAEYWLDNSMQDVITAQLAVWAGSSFNLAISEISYSELIDGAYKEKITRVKQLLSSFTQIEVTQRVLSGAGILSNVYKVHNNQTSGASIQDKIIGSTAFIHHFPIITANVSDFPHPFFTTIESQNLQFQKKEKSHYLTVDVLKPNYTMLNYWYSRVR